MADSDLMSRLPNITPKSNEAELKSWFLAVINKFMRETTDYNKNAFYENATLFPESWEAVQNIA